MTRLPFLMNARVRWLPWSVIAAATALLVPLTLRPSMAFALIGLVVMVATAAISVGVPLGLSGFAAPVVAIVGHDPFPAKAVPLISLIWIALGVAFTFGRHARVPLRAAIPSPLVISSLALLALLLARLPASTDSSYGSFKVELFLISNMAVLAAGIVLGTRQRDIELFLILTLAIDALSGLLVIRQLGTVSSGASDRFGLPQQSVIALGTQGAEALMVATYLLLKARHPWQQMLAACLIPVSLVALLASGSRGPVLGGTAGLLVLLAMLARSRQVAIRLVILVILFASSYTLVAQLVPSAAVQRSLSTVLGTRSGLASNGRDQLWSAAWRTFSAHPVFGIGTGSFAKADRREACPGPGCLDKYPHNVLLETGVELGIGGALAMLGVLVSAAAAILRAWRLPDDAGDYASVVFALFVAAAVTAMLTGDLAGDGAIWLTGGIGLGLLLAHGKQAQTHPHVDP